MLMLRQLERLGIAADVVGNGREAIAAVAGHDYPLILMDLRMPELDGFDATRAIRASEDGRRRVPIVAVTANAARADREACLEAGMDDHLAKPVT
ncbi:MAG TPA: response regulator, partial [Solirubrobacteraceae bacterium]|nr:response regulator [Solirubrobacteraceae bacterium]